MNRRGMTSKGVRAWKNFEREVARALRKLAPGARRCLQYQKNHGAPDVQAAVLRVECKSGRTKRHPVEKVFLKAESEARAHRGTLPAVVSKAGPRGTKLVTLRLGDFIRIAAATAQDRRRMWKGGQP